MEDGVSSPRPVLVQYWFGIGSVLKREGETLVLFCFESKVWICFAQYCFAIANKR